MIDVERGQTGDRHEESNFCDHSALIFQWRGTDYREVNTGSKSFAETKLEVKSLEHL